MNGQQGRASPTLRMDDKDDGKEFTKYYYLKMLQYPIFFDIAIN